MVARLRATELDHETHKKLVTAPRTEYGGIGQLRDGLHKVLGVTAQASLQEIRDAYKQKAKLLSSRWRRGGMGFSASWVQAYEMLSSARLPAPADRLPAVAADPSRWSKAAARCRVGPRRNSRHRR